METTTVKQLGIGSGAGAEVTVLARKEIEKILDNINLNDVFRKAYKSMVAGYLNGYCELNLKTGELEGCGLADNTMNQACDSVCLDLYCLGKDEDIADYVDDDGDPYEIDEMIEWDELRNYDIAEQLDEWYKA